MVDVTGEVSAVRREVGGRVLEAGQARAAAGRTTAFYTGPQGPTPETRSTLM